jgi:tetratricopeptide (TPR) repeat protein
VFGGYIMLTNYRIQDIDYSVLELLIQRKVKESEIIEYKPSYLDSDAEDKPIWMHIVAFANCRGGHLIIGISTENGVPQEILGVKVEPNKDTGLKDQITKKVFPFIDVEIKTIPLKEDSDKEVVIIQIPNSLDPCVWKCSVDKYMAAIRDGDSTKKIGIFDHYNFLKKLFEFKSITRAKEIRELQMDIKLISHAIGTDLDYGNALTFGNEALYNKEYETAFEWYNKAILIVPNDAVAWGNKGVALHCLGKDEDAIECLEKAIQINPNYNKADGVKKLIKLIREKKD